jgi:hypothetical protein
MKLPNPKTQKQKILLALIESNKGISERQFSYNGFRQRLSELRRYLNIKFTWKKFKNEFGHPGQFKIHWLTNDEKKKAISVYLKIVKS